MPNPSVLLNDTTLYSSGEPDGRVFLAGESWPGDAWTSQPGGERVGKNTAVQAMKDLQAAQAAIDHLNDQVARVTHSAAEADAAKSAAEAQVADLEQRAITAEKALTGASDASAGYMRERDQARAEVTRLTSALEVAQAEGAKVAGLVADLDAANQTIADLNDAAKAAAKPKKGAPVGPAPNAAAAPAADAAQASDAT
jgi:paraquat-inducible protein B